MYSTANILSSPLQPCLGKGCRLSQHSMASGLRDRKRMPPAPGWCGCSRKLRVSHRHLQGCEWVSLRVHSLLPRYSLRSLLSLGCCHPLTFFLLRPEISSPPFFPLPLFVASNQGFVPSLTFCKIHAGVESSEF